VHQQRIAWCSLRGVTQRRRIPFAVGIAAAGFGSLVGLGLEASARSIFMASLNSVRQASTIPSNPLFGQQFQNLIEDG